MADTGKWPREGAAVFAFCLLWAAVMMRRVLAEAGRTVPQDIGDPVLNAAVLHWNATTLPLTRDWWNFPAFVPASGVTAFTEHLLGAWPLASPVSWISGSPVLAYNVAVLLSFPLSAVAMFALVRALTGSGLGGLVAAVAFAFSPFRAGQLSHLQMLLTWGMPLALLGLHRCLDRPTWRALALVGAGWLATVLSNAYLLVFFGVYVAVWGLFFCSTKEGVKRVPAIAAAGLLASVPLAPILRQYAEVHTRYGFQRSLEEIVHFSADVDAILHPWPTATVSSLWLQPWESEAALFPGLVVVLLAASAWLYRERLPEPAPLPAWFRPGAAGVAALFLTAAGVAAVTDVRFSLAGLRVSLTDVGKPLAIGAAAFVIWLGATRRMRPAFAARSPRVCYALMALICWVLSLGPEAKLHGETIARDLPYFSLLELPGMQGLRVPARFWMLGTMSLAVLAGYGTAALARRSRRAPLVAAAAVAGILAEGWVAIDAAPSDPFPRVAPQVADAPVLELPMDRVDVNTPAMLRAVTGGYRTLNGYSGYEPPHFRPLTAGIAARNPDVLSALRLRMPIHVSVPEDDTEGFRSWLVGAHPDARQVADAGGRTLYLLPRLPARDEPPAIEAPFRTLAASCGAPYLADITDGSLETRWACGPATKGQSIELDLGTVRQVAGLVNLLGPFRDDAPALLQVAVSPDRRTWSTAWTGRSHGEVLRAALDDPQRMPVTFRFTAVRGRYVRLTQIGEETQYYWSIAELRLLVAE